MVTWDQVTPDDVVRAIPECDRLGPEHFFAQHGFAPTTNYELVWAETYRPARRTEHWSAQTVDPGS